MTAPAVTEPAAVVTPPAAASTPAAEPSGSAAGTPATPTPAAVTPPPAPTVPASYPLVLSDGTLLASDALTRITDRAKALGVTDPKVAQAFVEAAEAETAEAFRAYQEAQKVGGTAHQALVASYQKAALEHPEVGANDPALLERRAHEAGLVIAEHFPELLPILKETGYAARWEVIAGFSRLWRSMQESPLAVGAASRGGAPVPWERQMYEKGIPLDTGAASPTP